MHKIVIFFIGSISFYNVLHTINFSAHEIKNHFNWIAEPVTCKASWETYAKKPEQVEMITSFMHDINAGYAIHWCKKPEQTLDEYVCCRNIDRVKKLLDLGIPAYGKGVHYLNDAFITSLLDVYDKSEGQLETLQLLLDYQAPILFGFHGIVASYTECHRIKMLDNAQKGLKTYMAPVVERAFLNYVKFCDLKAYAIMELAFSHPHALDSCKTLIEIRKNKPEQFIPEKEIKKAYAIHMQRLAILKKALRKKHHIPVPQKEPDYKEEFYEHIKRLGLDKMKI